MNNKNKVILMILKRVNATLESIKQALKFSENTRCPESKTSSTLIKNNLNLIQENIKQLRDLAGKEAKNG